MAMGVSQFKKTGLAVKTHIDLMVTVFVHGSKGDQRMDKRKGFWNFLGQNKIFLDCCQIEILDDGGGDQN